MHERRILPTGIPPGLMQRAEPLAVLLMFSAGFVIVLSHAFVRTEDFIHRGDDAFYYFQIAANFPENGRWTFDGIHSTNGVQPLWALILTVFAQALNWLGVSDPPTLARIFVGLSASLHFGSCVILYRLLERTFSTGTAIVASGAFLFPIGIVWARVWGMENSLYGLLLLASLWFFQFRFLERPTTRRATALGVLLALTALARLNAILFIPCLLGYYLLAGPRSGMLDRFRLSLVCGVAASALILPYFLFNLASTGHLLPISGEVKSIGTDELLRSRGIESRISPQFAWLVAQELVGPARWLVTSRVTDAFWVLGGRLIWEGLLPLGGLVAMVTVLASAPLAVGKPREWLGFLGDRYARLKPFSYVLIFAVLNAAVSAFLYPLQLSYAIVRWWLVENEIVITVLAATLVATSIGFIARRSIPASALKPALAGVLALLTTLYVWQAVQFYGDEEVEFRDWNASWNDESYEAARWLSASTPRNAVIGSWNAGVLGYYSNRRVVNLDGLINDFDLLPYLKSDDIAGYIRRERIEYLSDMGPMFERHRLEQRMRLTEVYRHRNALTGDDYRILRVDGPDHGSSAGL